MILPFIPGSCSSAIVFSSHLTLPLAVISLRLHEPASLFVNVQQRLIDSCTVAVRQLRCITPGGQLRDLCLPWYVLRRISQWDIRMCGSARIGILRISFGSRLLRCQRSHFTPITSKVCVNRTQLALSSTDFRLRMRCIFFRFPISAHRLPNHLIDQRRLVFHEHGQMLGSSKVQVLRGQRRELDVAKLTEELPLFAGVLHHVLCAHGVLWQITAGPHFGVRELARRCCCRSSLHGRELGFLFQDRLERLRGRKVAAVLVRVAEFGQIFLTSDRGGVFHSRSLFSAGTARTARRHAFLFSSGCSR